MKEFNLWDFDVEKEKAKVRKWDLRFLDLAKRVAQWSKDPSTKTGAAIVRGKKIIAVGFNGFPTCMEDRPEWYNDRNEKYSRIIHCEINALISAQQSVDKATLYTWPFACCDRCVVQMLQAGIDQFVFPELSESLKPRWGESINKSKLYIDECDAHWTEYKQGFVDLGNNREPHGN